MTETDALLATARECADEGLEGHALRRYRKLDQMLSSGQGTLPQAWTPAPLPSAELWREPS